MSYDSRVLFEGINFGIDEGEKVGLIGPNASGKSSLLKILARSLEPESGEIIFRAQTKVTHLEQDPAINPTETLLSYLCSGSSELEPWEVQEKAEELIWRLGMDNWKLEFETQIGNLSGGWKKRVSILRAMVSDPDLLLLDEPTNHLDIEGILWLERVISEAKFACITVTHDRVFLDRVSQRILELDRRNPGGLLVVKGNYSTYLETKDAMIVASQGREQSLKSTLRRETEWLKAGVKAQRSKQFARIQRHEELSNELSAQAQLNVSKNINIEFQSVGEAPKRLIEAKKISKSFHEYEKLFSNLDLFIGPTTRLGIVGENGCGKSTLLRVLLDQERPDSGKIFRAENLKVAYFEQNRESLNPETSLLRSVCPYGDSVFFQGRAVHIRSYLDRFLFTQEKMDLPIQKLSGGEQSRVLIAKLMLVECNLLVLDEPTNDLDIMSLNILQDCLNEFEGAVILVSHDRYFLDQVSNEILAFPILKAERAAGQLHMFADIAQWESWHQQNSPKGEPTTSRKKVPTTGRAPKEKPSTNQKEIDKITRRIEQLERKYKEKDLECHRPDIQSDLQKLVSLGEEMKSLQQEMDSLYEELARLL